MKDKQELMKDLEVEFDRIKKEIGFESSLDEINNIFFIKDYILHEGYVSENLNRQIASRITDTLMSWNNYLHGLIFSNPGNMMVMNENRMFQDSEKKNINKLISKSMSLVSLNTLIGITKDKEKEKEFFDKSVKFWQETLKPEIEKIMIKVNKGWKGQE